LPPQHSYRNEIRLSTGASRLEEDRSGGKSSSRAPSRSAYLGVGAGRIQYHHCVKPAVAFVIDIRRAEIRTAASFDVQGLAVESADRARIRDFIVALVVRPIPVAWSRRRPAPRRKRTPRAARELFDAFSTGHGSESSRRRAFTSLNRPVERRLLLHGFPLEKEADEVASAIRKVVLRGRSRATRRFGGGRGLDPFLRRSHGADRRHRQETATRLAALRTVKEYGRTI